MNSPHSDNDTDKWLEQLSSATHSPKGDFSAEKSYSLLQQRLKPARRKQNLFSIQQVRTAVAGLLVLVGLGWAFYPDLHPVRTLTASTRTQTRCVRLPDGSEVTLNRHSRLNYPESFGKERIVELNGEAYFEVSKNPQKPFRVKANGVTVSVLGTHFNVNAYAADSLVETTLLEGSVSVCNNANGEQKILKPNETAIYRKTTGTLSIHAMKDAQKEITWREGILDFEDAPMEEIARELSHHFNVDIQIADKQLRNYKLNARFHQDETLTDILDMLAPIGGFTYHATKNNTIELKRTN